MPFPWKKGAESRISRLVNHHLHKSQKRRGDSSLVVETGFPTSLVDLFIKNREKLKRKSKSNRQNSPVDVNDPPIAVSAASFPSPPRPDSPVTSSPIIEIHQALNHPSTQDDESNSCVLTHVEEIQSENEIVAESFSEGRFRNQESVESVETGKEEDESKKCEAAEMKMIRSKRERIRSKMKKLVPKKLRIPTKQPESPQLETVEEELYMDSNSSTRSIEEVYDIACRPSESPMKHKEVLEETKTGQTWIYKVVYVIILFGLIKGRSFALVLALLWYLLLKLYPLISKLSYGSFR